MENVIEKAVSSNVFFTEIGGSYTTQDLYQLPLNQLDKIYKDLKGQSREEDSLINRRTNADRLVELKIAVVTHVVRYRQELADKKAQAEEAKQKRDLIKNLIEEKKLSGLKELSLEELQAKLAEI